MQPGRRLSPRSPHSPSSRGRCPFCPAVPAGAQSRDHEAGCPRATPARTSVLPDLTDNAPTSAPATSCPFIAMGCEATEIPFGELATHLKQSMPKHLELLCVRIHRNAQILAEQQTLLEKLIQRSPLEVRAGGGAAPFATIGEALDAAEDGDRIVVHEGSYRETLVIEKRVTLQAAGTVRVENATEGNVIVSRVTCTITGFALQQRSKNFFCIRVMGVDNTTLIDACET